MFDKRNIATRISTLLLLAGFLPQQLFAAGPAPLDLLSTAPFVILSGAAVTSTGGGVITGNVGASPIAGSAIGVTCAQVVGTIYAVDASGPPCAVMAASLLTTAKGDLTTAYDNAAGRTPIPSGPFLNPGGGNIGGLNLAPGLYKFTGTALVTGSDVTLTGGPDDVWIFQIASDLQVGSGIKVILAGGARAKNVFWQVGSSAVIDTFAVFKGTILADQSITLKTSSTIEGRALAFSGGVTFNGIGASVPTTAPEIAVEQPLGVNIIDGGSKDFGSVIAGGNNSLVFTIKNTGDADLTGLAITIDGADSTQFSVTATPTSPVSGPNGTTTFTVRFAPLTTGLKIAALHIANNDSDENPFDIALSGTGTAVPVPEIVVEQPLGVNIADGGTKDFGSVVSGGNASLVFTIKNTGTADLTGLGITIDGADSLQFTVTATPTSPVSGPAGSTTFTVRFAPTSTGLKTAALHIANNDSDENPFDIALTGTGTAIAVAEIAVEQPLGVNIADGGSKDFGSVVAGGNNSLTFTIKNTGTADLTGLGITIDGADSSLFSITLSPVAPVSGPAGSTTFTVQFTPLSAGLKTAALHIASNDSDENPFDITITGTGTAVAVPEIVVEQPLGVNIADGGSKDFGLVVAGGNTSLTFTIRNTGTANLTGLGITIDGADSAQFSITASPTSPVGGPSGGTTFTVRFAPVTTGLKTAALHIASNDSDENPFDITLTGTGTAVAVPEIVVEQPLGVNIADGGSKDFGSVVAGGNTSLTFSIKNIGNADLTGLGITINGADASQFTVTASPTAPVSGPSGGTTFTVRFAPTTTGLKVAALHIASNDSDENPFDIGLTGTGTAVPVPEISVEQPLGVNIADGGSKDFGLVVAGGNTSLTFTIKNTGTANLTGLGITIDGANAGQFTITASPTSPVGGPSGGTTFTVRFAPTSAGSKTAALHIASNDSDENPFDITITGTGTAVPVPEIVVEQPLGVNIADGGSKDFGPMVAGGNTSLTFTIKNTGTADLTGLGITIDGADSAQFTITASPTSPVGGPSGGTTFTVRFAPTSVGLKTAALHIASNDSDENPFDITITGTGTAVPVPEIVVEQPLGINVADGGSKDFGSVTAGDNTSLTFTIRNTGNADLTGLGITIDGADASQFAVTSSPTSPVGGPSGGTTFTVRFAPTSVGGKTAALHIASNDSDENPFDITLSGTGTPALAITTVSTIKLNPQTGLFEQTVRISNIGTTTVTAARLLIQGLPSDVRVYNATGTNAGTPFVQHNFSLAPGATADFVIEYYRANRQAFSSPTFVVEDATPIVVIPVGTIIAIDRNVRLVDGRFLIEFSATAGRSYAVQYSADMTSWQTVIPSITAPSNKVQWYDDGPPKTESAPTSGSRFYRVVEMP